MGANASTAVPVYASGEVLDAARLNLTNAGIPVFGGTATRDAAFGGTGEKTLAEGQFAYLEDSNTTQYYDGAAWQSVGVAPGLTLTGSANPSAVASISINNCFSATYTNYLIQINLISSSAGTFLMRMRVGGTDNTTSDHNTSYRYSELTSVNVLDNNTNASSSISLNASAGNRSFFGQINIQRPFETEPTTGQFTSVGEAVTPNYYFNGAFCKTASTSFDGFTITPGAGTITGKIRVYGLALS
jgi:hypothetical protein